MCSKIELADAQSPSSDLYFPDTSLAKIGDPSYASTKIMANGREDEPAVNATRCGRAAADAVECATCRVAVGGGTQREKCEIRRAGGWIRLEGALFRRGCCDKPKRLNSYSGEPLAKVDSRVELLAAGCWLLAAVARLTAPLRTRAHSGLLRVASEQPTDADGGLPRFIDETKAQPEKKGAARRGDFSGAESQRTAAIGCGLRVAVLVATRVEGGTWLLFVVVSLPRWPSKSVQRRRCRLAHSSRLAVLNEAENTASSPVTHHPSPITHLTSSLVTLDSSAANLLVASSRPP
ncbi:hypothetical protein V9T40_008266 [Parthenolecanium corni]|uniref:Uncharacterized protein n=1 Tax=Parthenolecanium corni TaxID=536013 RepID=A0AAN9TKK3_9HEMI